MPLKRIRPRMGKPKGRSQGSGAPVLAPDDIVKDRKPRRSKRLRVRSPSPLMDLVAENEGVPKNTGVPENKNPSKKKRAQDSSADAKIDIPGQLKHAITETDFGYFEMIFPIGSLDGLQRLAVSKVLKHSSGPSLLTADC